MITQDILNGEGCAVIDPHGDLVEDILKIIPAKRAEDLFCLIRLIMIGQWVLICWKQRQSSRNICR